MAYLHNRKNLIFKNTQINSHICLNEFQILKREIRGLVVLLLSLKLADLSKFCSSLSLMLLKKNEQPQFCRLFKGRHGRIEGSIDRPTLTCIRLGASHKTVVIYKKRILFNLLMTNETFSMSLGAYVYSIKATHVVTVPLKCIFNFFKLQSNKSVIHHWIDQCLNTSLVQELIKISYFDQQNSSISFFFFYM